MSELAKLSAKSAKEFAGFIANHVEELASPSAVYKLAFDHPVKGVEPMTVFALADALVPFVYDALPRLRDADELVHSIIISAERTAQIRGHGQFSEGAGKKLRANLLAVLDNNAVRLKAKALKLLNAQDRAFQSSEVLSDIRPVLKTDGSIAIEAAVVYHTLRIRHTGTDRSFSVALDSKDLRDLKAAVDRAIEKESALSSMIQKAGVEQVKVS